jgi:hypothetical protein
MDGQEAFRAVRWNMIDEDKGLEHDNFGWVMLKLAGAGEEEQKPGEMSRIPLIMDEVFEKVSEVELDLDMDEASFDLSLGGLWRNMRMARLRVETLLRKEVEESDVPTWVGVTLGTLAVLERQADHRVQPMRQELLRREKAGDETTPAKRIGAIKPFFLFPSGR